MKSRHLSFLFFVVASPVDAQSYYCDRPRKPDVPSGYYAEYDEMDQAEEEVADYVREMQDYVDCLTSESDDAISEARRVARDWDGAVSEFNSR